MDKKDISKLQDALNYSLISPKLNDVTIGGIIWGIINIGLGLYSIKNNPVNSLLIIIGLLLIYMGLLSVKHRSIKLFIMYGIMLIILAFWNIGITLLNFANTYSLNKFWIYLGGFQFFSGITHLTNYRLIAQLPETKPSEEFIKIINEYITEITKNKHESKDFIEIKTIEPQSLLLHGKLFEDNIIIFISSNHLKGFVVNKDDLILNLIGKQTDVALNEVSVKIGGYNYSSCLISKGDLKKYSAWKNIQSEEVA